MAFKRNAYSNNVVDLNNLARNFFNENKVLKNNRRQRLVFYAFNLFN